MMLVFVSYSVVFWVVKLLLISNVINMLSCGDLGRSICLNFCVMDRLSGVCQGPSC